jgi:drug/metabolite transporter (DMT)-like permease
MVLSGLSFIVVNFFIKLLGEGDGQSLIAGLQSYPAHELVLARSVVSLTICLAVIRHRKLALFGNNKAWLIARGLAGTIALTIFFYSIHHLPLAVASIIQYLAPIFTVFFAIALLKEKVVNWQWPFIGLSFLGVGLIAYSKIAGAEMMEDISLKWILLGMISAFFSGIAYVSIIKLKTTDEPIIIVFYFPMIAIPFMIGLCFYEFVIPQGIEWFILLIIGIFTQFAQILMTKAFHLGDASLIAPIQYFGAIYAYLIGYFIFGETLSWIVDLGIIMILTGVVINSIIRNQKKL